MRSLLKLLKQGCETYDAEQEADPNDWSFRAIGPEFAVLECVNQNLWLPSNNTG